MLRRRRVGRSAWVYGALAGGALLTGSCGGEPPAVASSSPQEEAPAIARATEPAAAPTDAAGACGGEVGAVLEDPLELPEDLRLAAMIDLRDGELAAALEHLEAWARSDAEAPDVAEASADGGEDEGSPGAAAVAAQDSAPSGHQGDAPASGDEPPRGSNAVRPPTVAGLALSQVGFQVGHVRTLLGGLGIDPPEMLLLQGPDGELVWLWRLPCDHERLRALVTSGWGLQIRTLVAGALGETLDPQRFPFDLLFLPGDRLALVPAGGGLRLLRWLTDGGPRGPALGAPQVEEEGPAELLGTLAPAAIRLVVADRVGGVLTLRPASKSTGALRVRASAAGLEISDSLPTPP